MDADDEEIRNPRVISVRRMGAHDEEAVKALAGHVFSPLASLSFPRSPDALIAERGGELLGAGVFFPVPGSIYPCQSTWRYGDLLPKLGPMAFAGASAVLIFAWAAWALAQFGEPLSEAALSLRAAHTAGLMLATFDVLLPFSVFTSFDGRRVWDWNRPVWGVLAAAVLGLFLAGG